MFADESGCDIGEHCDVWGLGLIIYHMIVGTPIHDSFRHDQQSDIPKQVPMCIRFVILDKHFS